MLETLGHYKILERIGIGRTGSVYRARDTRAGRTVAIRVVADEIARDLPSREGFLRAARATAALSHPNLATLYEIGEDQGHLFLVFEYVPGSTLGAVISGRALNPRHALDLAIQLADALAVAHADAVVHGGIQSGNIVVTPKGNAKFLDFGLSVPVAHLEDGRQVTVSGSGARPQDVAYLSPEQLSGDYVDHRTDLFSLGAVLFEMLTGKLPFRSTTTDAIAKRILESPAPLPSQLAPQLPSEVDATVVKMLARTLEDRYQTAATLAAELRSAMAVLDARSGVGVNADATRHHAKPVTTQSRHRGAAFWAAVAVSAAVIAGGLLVAASDTAARWLASLTRLW
jgi:serine/threonine protein kinase